MTLIDPKTALLDVRLVSSPEAEAATCIYAVGDIHGRLDLLHAIQAQIVADIAERQPQRPVICYLGDYVDRGPHSVEVVERLLDAKTPGLPRVFLKGNHEERLLEFLETPLDCISWCLKYGGRDTLQGYGLSIPDQADAIDWHRLSADFRAALPDAHLAFYRSLRPAFVWRDFLFVHAGLNPERELDQQSEYDLRWIREPFLSSDREWPFRVVHGHEIVPAPVFRRNRIGIDTGAYRSGRLTCLVIDDSGLKTLSTADR